MSKIMLYGLSPLTPHGVLVTSANGYARGISPCAFLGILHRWLHHTLAGGIPLHIPCVALVS